MGLPLFYIKELIEKIKRFGVVGAISFVFIYVLGTLLFLPVTLLTFSGGVLYGFTGGLLSVLVGSNLGACAAFLLGRYFFRGWVKDKIEKDKKIMALDQAVSKRGWKIVALSRLSTVAPFTLLNYSFGLTNIHFFKYALVTFIAMLPASALYVYLGSTAGNIMSYFNKSEKLSPLQWGFTGVGIVASIVLIAYLGIVTKRYFKKESKLVLN